MIKKASEDKSNDFGKDGDLASVSALASKRELIYSIENSSTYDDPWYNMSVRDYLEQSHIDSVYTSVRTKKNKKVRELSAFNANNEWQNLAFGSYSGGGPPQEVLEQYLDTLKEEQLLDLEKNTLMDRKKKIISPFASDFVPSPFTTNGTALLKFNKHNRNKNVENALNNFFIEQKKLQKLRRKELKRKKKELEKSLEKENDGDLVFEISPNDQDFYPKEIEPRNNSQSIPNLDLILKKSDSNSSFRKALSNRSTTSSISGADDSLSGDEEENNSARGRVNIDSNKIIKRHGEKFINNLANKFIKLSASLNRTYFFRRFKVSIFSDFVESCYKLKVGKVLFLIKSGYGSGSTMTEEDETIFYSMFNRAIQYDQSILDNDQEGNLYNKNQIVTLKMLQEVPNFTIERNKMQKILQLLLENYGDINCFSPRNIYAPIHLAVSTNNIYLTTWLLKKKCNINLLSKNCDEEEFFSNGRVNKEKKIEKDANGVVREGPGLGLSPLMLAAKYGYIHIIALLVKAGVDLNLVSNEFNMKHPDFGPVHSNPLDGTALSKDIKEEEEEEQSKNIKGLTALHIAAMYGQTRAALFLLRVGANRQIQDQWGRTPSEVAFERYQLCIILY